MNGKIVKLLCAALLLLQSLWAHSQTGETNEIQAVNVAQQGGNVVVKFSLKSALASLPQSFSVANPARLAIDLPATTNGMGKNRQVVNEGVLRTLNFVQTADKMRVVLNLSSTASFEMQNDGTSLLVTIKPAPVDAGAAASKVENFSEARRSDEQHQIRDIGFRRGGDGEARIAVDLSDVNTGIDIKQIGSSLQVEFAKTTLPNHLRRRIDTADFATPVNAIDSIQAGGNARITIHPKGLWEHNAYQTDSQFVIEVRPIVENPNKLVQGSRGGYQGEKLSLNFQNVDVRRLLQVIGEFTGMNMVVSDTVAGNLTLILKDVPWDQALDIILQQRGLDMRKNGNVILIAPREEIATKEKLDFEARQQIGDLEPLRTESFRLNYHKAKSVYEFLKNKDQTVMSKRGAVIVDERTNKLFVTDVPTRLEDLRKLIAEIDIPMRQVLIEARIVEASDTFSKSVGMRLGVATRDPFEVQKGKISVGGPLYDNAIGLRDPLLSGANTRQVAATGGAYNPTNNPGPTYFNTNTNAINLPASSSSGQVGALSFILFNSQATRFLNLEVSALEADGRGKEVSSPRLVTADQVEAIIEQGVEIPYLTASASGATTISFRKANLSLKVKPQITPDGKVTLSLDINKDSPNKDVDLRGMGVPIDTKHVKTEVIVENGGTVVIGGIFTQKKSDNTTRVPLLGEIPYLGWLFRSQSKTDDKTELLIFVTPKIVSETMAIR